MLPYLRLGPLLLQTPGLALLVGVWVGLTLSEREAKRSGANANNIYNLVFLGLIAGLVGARLGYALRYLNAYLESPLSLFSLNPSTLSADFSLLCGLLTAWVYGKRKALPLLPTLDILAPGLAVFMVFMGVSHLLSGDAFGAPTTMPWSIFLWNEYRHPTQVYETLAALVILVAALRRPLKGLGAGMNFFLVVALSAAARLFLEAFRGDSLVWFGNLRATQVVSLLVLLTVLWLARELFIRHQHPDKILQTEIESIEGQRAG
jgi:phosphatidylglycerol---prolipoprotein diacylglyceryl transferase